MSLPFRVLNNSQPVSTEFASSFSAYAGLPYSHAEPFARLIEQWHTENPTTAQTGVCSQTSIEARQGKRRLDKRAERQVRQEEKQAQKECARYVMRHAKENYKAGKESAPGSPLLWIQLACWAIANRDLIREMIERFRELLADFPWARERVLS